MFAGWDEYRLINREISRLVGGLPKSDLGEVISYVLTNPGKRVRPLILIFSSQAFGGDAHRLQTPPWLWSLYTLHLWSTTISLTPAR